MTGEKSVPPPPPKNGNVGTQGCTAVYQKQLANTQPHLLNQQQWQLEDTSQGLAGTHQGAFNGTKKKEGPF